MEEAIRQIQDSLQSMRTVQQDILDRLQSIEEGDSKPESNTGINSSTSQSGVNKPQHGAYSLPKALGNQSPASLCTASVNAQADPVARVDSSIQDV